MEKKVTYKNNKNILEVDFKTSNEPKKAFRFNLNKLIIIGISIIALAFMITYSIAINTENTLRKLHTKTTNIQTENIEMKTKVEFSKSLYNVQNKAETVNFLHKPEKVIEIESKSKDTKIDLSKYSNKKQERALSGY